ncbi:hypothetical protein TNIN_292731 [Trichonephila inaurata madagascariensis]|uniref:Uncharacterized protein n=1 Tax=Trichonephila inaurata madagascariensis TaxID=2747483 RepID=A0A8X6YS28_9ARAC|nr:hypothetical protein TNIN_292731 [Trichonephila inaurata madagascariensis]
MSGRDEASSEERSLEYDAVEPTLDPEQHCAFIRAQEKEIAYDEVRLSYLNIEKKDSPGNLHVCCPETRGRKNGHHGEAEKEARQWWICFTFEALKKKRMLENSDIPTVVSNKYSALAGATANSDLDQTSVPKCYHKLGAFQKHSKTQLNSHPSQQTQARISKTRLQTSPKILKAHNIASKPINPDHKQYVSEEFKTLFIQGNRARKAWQFTRCPQDKRTLNNLQNKIHRKVRSLTNKTWENTLNSLSVKGGSLRGMSKALRKKRTPVSTLNGPNNIALSDSDKEESLACSLETQFQDNDITNETTDIILLTGSSRITFLTKIISMIPPDTTQTF